MVYGVVVVSMELLYNAMELWYGSWSCDVVYGDGIWFIGVVVCFMELFGCWWSFCFCLRWFLWWDL